MASKSKWRISVASYPFEQSTKSLLNLLRDGKYHESRGIHDEQPFSGYAKVSQQEIQQFVDDKGQPDQKAIHRYSDKKRDMASIQLAAMKTLGIVNQRNRTVGAAYALTPFGSNIVRGLALIQEAEKNGLNFEQMLERLSKE